MLRDSHPSSQAGYPAETPKTGGKPGIDTVDKVKTIVLDRDDKSEIWFLGVGVDALRSIGALNHVFTQLHPLVGIYNSRGKPIDQVPSVANDDPVDEIQNVIPRVVTPAPKRKYWLVCVYFQRLPLLLSGNCAYYSLLKVDPEAGNAHLRSEASCKSDVTEHQSSSMPSTRSSIGSDANPLP